MSAEPPEQRDASVSHSFYGVFDPAQGRFSYVMAGHPAPIVLPRIGPAAPLHGRGLPIGMIEHAQHLPGPFRLTAEAKAVTERARPASYQRHGRGVCAEHEL